MSGDRRFPAMMAATASNRPLDTSVSPSLSLGSRLSTLKDATVR